MKEQLNKGIIEKCEDLALDDSYYMPHRAVIKTDRDTTKLRIVYDASSKLNGPSLNDCLLPGPNLNPNVLDIILKFRENKIAFSADIEAAFLQIKVKNEDQNYLRFIYFDDCDIEKNIVPYKMKRVTFGVTCSPFILAATIKHHIKQYKKGKGECVEMLDSSLYVDDLFYGAESVSKAFSLSSDAVFILGDAGFNLRKLNTNSKELKELWVENGLCDISSDRENKSFKVLGLVWNVVEDKFELEVTSLLDGLDDLSACKRSVLHTVAKIFDPAGFVSPFVLRVKHLMQEIWERGLNWDDDLPEDMMVKWKDWCSEIGLLKELRIDRHYFSGCMHGMSCNAQLHVFCDASPVAYGAVAYFRFENDSGEILTSFIMSKCRVSPLKKLTLPRLELMGALIASRIVSYLKNIFTFQTMFLWTDSKIVLSWIKGSAKKWKPFVCNRVMEIQQFTNPIDWRHCAGKSNPADILTRGCGVRDLQRSWKWWHGPEFLSLPEDQWPRSDYVVTKEEVNNVVEEQKSKPELSLHCAIEYTTKVEFTLDLERYNSIKKVYRITAWVKRFIFNAKNKKEDRKFDELSADELDEAEKMWIRQIQRKYYFDELKCLKEGKQVSKESKILDLNPILSADDLIVVKGRLQKSNLEFYTKHPIIIPSKDRFAELLIWDAHEKVFHAGVSNTIVQLREKFWLTKGRQAIKNQLKKCVVCKRLNSVPGKQITAPLPANRIEQAPPFSVVGIDFGGPLYVSDNPDKQYILLFTCAVTRSVHLELVRNLTTETFLLAFRRFVARRGLCSTVYSDNARTFKRAELELKYWWSTISDPKVKDFYSTHGITWKYIVEKASWWGGFYERLIRSVKVALRKTLGKSSLTREQLETVITEIEGVLNSRPLTYVYTTSDEPIPLTPAHFLLGRRVTNLPAVKLHCEGQFATRKLLVKTFNYRERLMQSFWNRWKKDYLVNLRSTHLVRKNEIREFKINDIVLIHQEHLPRNFWKLGRIIDVFPGRDGKIRSCSMKTETGVVKRPVQLLYNLELFD